MEAILNSEKVTLTLRLNAADVQDFLSILRYLRFPIEIENRQKESIEKVESPKELLMRFASESPDLPILEDESMDEINAEINAYREEKRLKTNVS